MRNDGCKRAIVTDALQPVRLPAAVYTGLCSHKISVQTDRLGVQNDKILCTVPPVCVSLALHRTCFPEGAAVTAAESTNSSRSENNKLTLTSARSSAG